MSDFKPCPFYKRSARSQARFDAANANMAKRCRSLKNIMISFIDGLARGESAIGNTFMLPSIFKNREEYVYFAHGKYIRDNDGAIVQDVYHRFTAYHAFKHWYFTRGFELTLTFKEGATYATLSKLDPNDRAYYRKTDPKNPSAMVVKKKIVRFAQGTKP